MLELPAHNRTVVCWIQTAGTNKDLVMYFIYKFTENKVNYVFLSKTYLNGKIILYWDEMSENIIYSNYDTIEIIHQLTMNLNMSNELTEIGIAKINGDNFDVVYSQIKEN